MKILMAASECVPFVKVGGLADVVGTLPRYLKSKTNEVRVILPKYRQIDEAKFNLRPLPHRLIIPVGSRYEYATLKEGTIGNSIPVYFIENDRYFNRPQVYRTPEGDYPDNEERFIFFSRAVLEACKALLFQPDIIHCHDWQTGLIPAYLKTLYLIDAFFNRTSTVYTIHNIAYQGSFTPAALRVAGLPASEFTWNKLEFFGNFNFMKIGLVYADALSTVSPTYAKEIQFTGEGRGMEGVLKSRHNDLAGILNGIDYDEWNPSKDPLLAANFSANDTSGKAVCKEDLQKACGLPVDPAAFLIGAVSRLDPQKGYDLVADAIPRLMKENVQLAILGSGDKNLLDILTSLAAKYPKKISFNTGFNNALAHKIYAGCDAFLMPSRFEPCGLGQMIALTYGSLPVVRRTGGLVDTVQQFNQKTGKGNGFLFIDETGAALITAVLQALDAYRSKTAWKTLMKNAFASDFSWKKEVKGYIALYEKAQANHQRTSSTIAPLPLPRQEEELVERLVPTVLRRPRY